MSSPISYDLQGQGGGVVLQAGGSATGVFRWVQVLTDTVFDNLAVSNLLDSNNLGGVTIPAGVGIGGRITNIEVISGLVIAYYA